MAGGAYGTGKKGKATRLHSELVRTRGACERCGESDYSKLQCAHILSRRYNATRTDETNAFCLCVKCHMFFTDHPIEFASYVKATVGMDVYEALYRRAQAGVKSNDAYWQSEIDRLTALLKAAA